MEIQAIYDEHKGNYGYRRITLELRNRGFVVNQKKVQRLMKLLGLSSQIRRKRKYSSYQGEVGKKADNLSDQGWQYQHDFYHHFLEDKGTQPSMSRKGNSPDNGMMESFSFLSLRCFMVTRRRFTHLNIETSYCRLY